MKSKSILLALTISASALVFSCNNDADDGDDYAAGVDGYNENTLTDVKASHPEDFQADAQVQHVATGATHIATKL